MKGRAYLFPILLFLSVVPAFSQSWDDIKGNNAYLYGEGWGTTVAEADQAALSDLVSKISVTITGSSVSEEEEVVWNGALDAKSSVQLKVQTYSGAVLSNTERLIVRNEPDAYVGRYVKRNEVDRIFEGRKNKVKEFIGLAQNAEKNYKIDDCLRYYYWAYVLVHSLQHPNEAVYADSDGRVHVLSAWLPAQMNAVFDGLKAEVSGKEGSDLLMRFSYKGQPVESLDYTYFDGKGWSNVYSAKEGEGVLELPASVAPEKIQLKYEFEYRGQAHLDKELQLVMNALKMPAMRKAYCMVRGSQNFIAEKTQSVETDKAQKIVVKIIQAIREKNVNSLRGYFTDQGWDMFQRLVAYGNCRIVGEPELVSESHRGETRVHGLKVAFSPKNGIRDAFVEGLVFTFNRNQKIDALAFSLGERAREDIMRHDNWPMESRKDIVAFLENYKTAFALKRLDYLRSIFDDNAVIIVGRVLRNVPVRQGDMVTSQNIIKKNRLTKTQYMKNLEVSFQSNEFINIRFTDTEVLKGRADLEDYGIQIRQDYYSTNYGDAGYLFLKVDLNNPDEPIIRVRTWQESPDPIDGLYGLGDF